MSAMEKMLESAMKTVLNHMGLDVEVVKSEVTTRIANFEKSVETLNNTLIAHHAALQRIEENQQRIMRFLFVNNFGEMNRDQQQISEHIVSPTIYDGACK